MKMSDCRLDSMNSDGKPLPDNGALKGVERIRSHTFWAAKALCEYKSREAIV